MWYRVVTLFRGLVYASVCETPELIDFSSWVLINNNVMLYVMLASGDWDWQR